MKSLPFSQFNPPTGLFKHTRAKHELRALASAILSVGLLFCGMVHAEQPLAGAGMPEPGRFSDYKAKAEKGNPEAQTLLGLCYHQGLGVKQDDVEAVKWFRKAARQGLAPAQYNLGISYRDGLGIEKDTAEAVKWFGKAADQGEPHAQCRLGFIYCAGWGVAKDVERGCMYLNLAAASVNRFPEAEEAREALQSIGREMTPEQIVGARAKAAEWARDAADRGNPDAQYALSMMYFNEHCLPKNLVRALLYISLAAQNNQVPEAGYVRKAIEKKMTAEQIAEARRMVREWKPIPPVK